MFLDQAVIIFKQIVFEVPSTFDCKNYFKMSSRVLFNRTELNYKPVINLTSRNNWYASNNSYNKKKDLLADAKIK